jgi:hypothetical protein
MSTILWNLSWTVFMARRNLPTPDERQILFGVPTDRENLARHYMLSSQDLALAATRRGDTNQIGFAVQLGLLRHPGFGFTLDAGAPVELVAFLGEQIGVPVAAFERYASRPATASVRSGGGTWPAATGQRRSAASHLKSEQRHFLTQAICTFKQGRIADRTHEAQQFRASGLNLVIAAIVYWNSTYIADAVNHFRAPASPRPTSCSPTPRQWAGATSHSQAISSGTGQPKCRPAGAHSTLATQKWPHEPDVHDAFGLE